MVGPTGVPERLRTAPSALPPAPTPLISFRLFHTVSTPSPTHVPCLRLRSQVFAKCGILKEDDDGRPRVKIYRDKATGMSKGDGLVSYLKEPSVSVLPAENTVATGAGHLHVCVWCRIPGRA